MADTMSMRRKGVFQDFRTVIEDAEALVSATSEVAGAKVIEARKRLADSLELAKEAYERVRQMTFDRVNEVEERVRENPFAAIGIALGVGAFVGMLLLGRRSRGG
jgi:ElaB/YqjD/DUF883 family membrane-anchored ribosome-binding protein